MNDQILSGRARAALAFLAAEIRGHTGATPWQEPGILDAISKATANPLCTSSGALALAVIRAALDPTIRTPAPIALDGKHWHEPVKDPRDRPAYYGPSNVEFCRHEVANEVTGEPQRCGMFVHPGEECTHRRISRRDSEAIRARAREAIAAAKADYEQAVKAAQKERRA